MYVFARHQNKNDTGVSCVNLSPTDTGLLGNFLLLSLEHNIWLRGSFAHLPFSRDIVISPFSKTCHLWAKRRSVFAQLFVSILRFSHIGFLFGCCRCYCPLTWFSTVDWNLMVESTSFLKSASTHVLRFEEKMTKHDHDTIRNQALWLQFKVEHVHFFTVCMRARERVNALS